MELKNNVAELPKSIKWLKIFARISAWLLLAAVVVLIVTGWGITHTEIIYKTSFGLIDRRLADSIHRATNLPLAVLFFSHVFLNIRLAVYRKNRHRFWLIDITLIIIGLILIALVFYMELRV
ncbi:MAG: hypothetical protein M1409_07315 [Actinobacteria bacterium]|nr:hypothetical protein [Actinomycetota bacterium]